MSVTATVLPPCYPQPPSGLELTPDVESMYTRYIGYLQDKEPLASMAYFCVTVLVDPFAGIAEAAREYRVSRNVLCEIRKLSSTRGGRQARKADGKGQDLTDQERRFLKKATKAVIERAAQKDRSGSPQITKSGLTHL